MTGIIIDVVLLLILIICVAIGYFKGFLRTVLSLLGTVGSLVLAYLVKDVVAGILNSWFNWGTMISNALMKQISSLSINFSSQQATTAEELKTIISESDAGVIYKKIFSALLPNEITVPTTIAEIISNAIADIAMTVISFIIVFVLIKLIVFVLNRILKKIPRKSLVGKLNQILGCVVGLINGVIFVSVIMILAYFLCMIPSINEVIYPFIQQTFITKHIYELLGQLLL